MSRIPMAIFAAALGLGGCEPSGQAAGTAPGEDRYAGLDSAIKTWHAEIKATDAQCKDKAEAQKCQAFEVACKGEREVTPGEAAKGVSAKVAVAMGWEGWDAARSEYQPESTVAEFQKVGGAWKRLPTGPVNLSTCVPS